MFAAIVAAAALGAPQDLPPPVATTPAAPTRGVCERDADRAITPEALAARFNDVSAREYPEHRQAAMAALLTEDATLFNGHDNVTLTSEAFLALIGLGGKPGRLEPTVAVVSGGTVVTRSAIGGGREIVTVIRSEGGCIATVATFYD